MTIEKQTMYGGPFGEPVCNAHWRPETGEDRIKTRLAYVVGLGDQRGNSFTESELPRIYASSQEPLIARMQAGRILGLKEEGLTNDVLEMIHNSQKRFQEGDQFALEDLSFLASTADNKRVRNAAQIAIGTPWISRVMNEHPGLSLATAAGGIVAFAYWLA